MQEQSWHTRRGKCAHAVQSVIISITGWLGRTCTACTCTNPPLVGSCSQRCGSDKFSTWLLRCCAATQLQFTHRPEHASTPVGRTHTELSYRLAQGKTRQWQILDSVCCSAVTKKEKKNCTIYAVSRTGKGNRFQFAVFSYVGKCVHRDSTLLGHRDISCSAWRQQMQCVEAINRCRQ